MTKSPWPVVAILLLLLPGCAWLDAAGPSGSKRFQKAVDAVYPALVRIQVVTPRYRGGRQILMQGAGSGAIVSPDGYVVTNHHVAGKATNIVCVLSNKEEIRAKRIGTDPLADICVLKLTEKRTYPYVTFGDSDKLKVGDTVLAMGSPGSISQSVTVGVISNTDLILPGRGGRLRLDGENVGALVKWLAHDAAIYRGNSGGPLVNPEGEIVGINELGLGLGAAIPGNLAKAVIDQIISHGEPERSSLGLVIQPLLKSGGRKQGVLVSAVTPGGSAEQAGFQPGDIILSYAGRPVTARFGEDLPVFNRLVFSTPVGAAVRVEIARNGEKKTLSVKTQRRTKARARTHEVKEWGMAAENLTDIIAKALKRPTTDGVLVANTRPGGPCSEAKPAIGGGDVITAVAGRPVKNVGELIAETTKIVKDQKDPVPTVVAFERKNEQWLTIVKVGIKDLPDRSPEARKAWLPASFQVLTTDLAEGLKLAGTTGIRLTDVHAGRSAEKAGLKVGDIITAIDGDRIRAARPEDADVFPAMVRQRRVGRVAKLSVIRDGKAMAIDVTLERSPKATREMKRHRDISFGFTVRDLSDEDRRTERIEKHVTGPVVSEVQPGSLAAVANLHVSDIALSVNGVATPTVRALKKVMTTIHKDKPVRIVFFVQRGIHTVFIEVEAPWLAEKE